MPEEINNQEQAGRRGRLGVSLAIGLVSLVGLIALGGCGKDGANSTAGGSNATPSPGTVVKNSIGMEFAYVPAGSFQMGSDQSWSSVKPAHQVTFAKGFYMGRHKVTQGLWQKMMGNNPTFQFSSKSCGENCPVENVTWDDAQEFIKKLNAANDGYTYRLPSEAEWEYACRAGTTGDSVGDLDSMAWHKANSNETIHPVGQKQPNAWGLYDMLGNDTEWCEDVWHSNYDGAPTDGSAWLSGGEPKMRVIRGSSVSTNARDIRLSGRQYLDQSTKTNTSFRVVAVPR